MVIDDALCEFSDMPKYMCEHCKKGIAKDSEIQKREVIGGYLVARFESACALCGLTIEIGEPITSVKDSGWAHKECE